MDFLLENVWISINISLQFVPRVPINNIPTLVQVMAWRRPGDKPLSEPMMVRLPTHICVTRPQWVNRRHFQMHSLEWKLWYFDSNFAEVCSGVFNCHKVSSGPGNCLSPTRCQDISYTGASKALRSHMVLQGNIMCPLLLGLFSMTHHCYQ